MTVTVTMGLDLAMLSPEDRELVIKARANAVEWNRVGPTGPSIAHGFVAADDRRELLRIVDGLDRALLAAEDSCERLLAEPSGLREALRRLIEHHVSDDCHSGDTWLRWCREEQGRAVSAIRQEAGREPAVDRGRQLPAPPAVSFPGTTTHIVAPPSGPRPAPPPTPPKIRTAP